jgi:hypothetical protein
MGHPLVSKNPRPEDVALISPRRGAVYLNWNGGMMEKWNTGIKSGTFLDL